MSVGYVYALVSDPCGCVRCIHLVCRCLEGPISPLPGPPQIGPRSQQIWVYLSCISDVTCTGVWDECGLCVCALVLDVSGCVKCIYLVCRSFYNPQSPHSGQPISTHLDSVILVYLQCISFLSPQQRLCAFGMSRWWLSVGLTHLNALIPHKCLLIFGWKPWHFRLCYHIWKQNAHYFGHYMGWV